MWDWDVHFYFLSVSISSGLLATTEDIQGMEDFEILGNMIEVENSPKWGNCEAKHRICRLGPSKESVYGRKHRLW